MGYHITGNEQLILIAEPRVPIRHDNYDRIIRTIYLFKTAGCLHIYCHVGSKLQHVFFLYLNYISYAH